MKFKGKCLKEDKVSFTHKNIVNCFTFFELNTWSCDLNTTDEEFLHKKRNNKNVYLDLQRYRKYPRKCM